MRDISGVTGLESDVECFSSSCHIYKFYRKD